MSAGPRLWQRQTICTAEASYGMFTSVHTAAVLDGSSCSAQRGIVYALFTVRRKEEFLVDQHIGLACHKLEWLALWTKPAGCLVDAGWLLCILTVQSVFVPWQGSNVGMTLDIWIKAPVFGKLDCCGTCSKCCRPRKVDASLRSYGTN
jgi:hypothetical protein